VTQGVRLTLAAWIGTAPLTAFHFHQVSLVAVVANPVVIPLFGAMALLPALAGALLALWSLGIAGWAFAMAALPVRVGVEIVRAIGGWEWAALDVPLPTVGEVLLLYMVMAGAVLRRRQPFRVVGVAALCCLATDVGWWASERSAPHLRATFLDVGQGDASVVELPGGRVLVVDAGGFAGSEFDTGAAIVEPFLRSRKIQSIDALVMSHAHPDHAAGLAHLVRAFAPSELWWTGDGGEGAAWAETVRALRETGTPARRLRAGDALVDYPEVEVLHPPRGWAAPSLNDGSLVLRVRDGATAIVLAGDAERRAETTMVDDARPLAATVLKVPHHGSRTSSTWPFVRAVGPVIAVASLGADNRFGHPAPEVAARYEAIGTRWLRTDRCGAVRVVGDGWQVVATAMRRDCESIRTPPRP
jgi:competence protein ComEC